MKPLALPEDLTADNADYRTSGQSSNFGAMEISV